MATDLQITANDGRRLAATLYEPQAGSANGIVVQINSSAWTHRRYYKNFCEFLAERGFASLTYDYRGTGDSAGSDPNEQSFVDCGAQDQPGATRFLLERFPGQRLVLVAHSLGGQIIGLSPHASAFRCVLIVAAAHGYWRLWPDAKTRWRLAFSYYVAWPLSLALLGRIPARALTGQSLTPRLATEIMRFGRHPRWLVDEAGVPIRPHNAEVRVPLRHLTFTDDEVVPPGAELEIDEFFPNAQRSRELHAPSDYGVDNVKHFGFFRRSMPRQAWDDAAKWLEENSSSAIATAS
jgi:predicted alpha/beta hydrolase